MRGDTGFPVRVRFAEHGKVRFVSHRDLARAFERAFRIEQLPLSFTQGFSPRPKVSFGLALSVGHESDAEYLDVELSELVALDGLPSRLSAALPEGITVTGVSSLVDRAPALQESVTTVAYRIEFADVSANVLSEAVDEARAHAALPVATTRKGRSLTEDIRPAIRNLDVVDDATVDLEVVTKPRGVRPAEVIMVLRELAGSTTITGEDRVLRTCQWIERDGERLEPLFADRRLPVPSGSGPRPLEACA